MWAAPEYIRSVSVPYTGGDYDRLMNHMKICHPICHKVMSCPKVVKVMKLCICVYHTANSTILVTTHTLTYCCATLTKDNALVSYKIDTYSTKDYVNMMQELQ